MGVVAGGSDGGGMVGIGEAGYSWRLGMGTECCREVLTTPFCPWCGRPSPVTLAEEAGTRAAHLRETRRRIQTELKDVERQIREWDERHLLTIKEAKAGSRPRGLDYYATRRACKSLRADCERRLAAWRKECVADARRRQFYHGRGHRQEARSGNHAGHSQGTMTDPRPGARKRD